MHMLGMRIFGQKVLWFISIGSNLGDRLLHLQLAVGMIAYRIGEIKSLSKVVETPAWGFEGKPFTMLVWRWILRFAQKKY